MIGFNYLGRLGHLGNQMFQYSCLVSCAKKMGVEAVCPQSEKHRYFSKSRLSDCFVLGFAADGYVHPDSSIRSAESTSKTTKISLDLNFLSEKKFLTKPPNVVLILMER
jgi:hypothetical protein